MLFTDFMIREPEKTELIGGIIPKNRVTLLHGQQGSGKTYSVIKLLNKEGIIPLYIDFDHTDGIDDLYFYRLDPKMLMALIDDLITDDLTNKVIIIDTYTRLMSYLQEKKISDTYILEIFEMIVKKYNVTLIVIGHTRNFVGKDGIFQDNSILARGVSEELFLEKAEYKKTKTRDAYTEYILHVVKGRSSGGSRMIYGWMRSDDDKPNIKEHEKEELAIRNSNIKEVSTDITPNRYVEVNK